MIAVVVGVPLGIIAGYKHNTFADLTTMLGSLVGVSMPIFWLALMLLWIFGLKLNLFPTTGRIDSEVELRTITSPGTTSRSSAPGSRWWRCRSS